MDQCGKKKRTKVGRTKQRKLKPPKVNRTKITTYVDFITSLTDFDNLYKPPATMELFADDNQILAIAGNPDLFDLAKVPGHTQSVECLVDLTTRIAEHYDPSEPAKECEPANHFEQEEVSSTLASQTNMGPFKGKQNWRSLLLL